MSYILTEIRNTFHHKEDGDYVFYFIKRGEHTTSRSLRVRPTEKFSYYHHHPDYYVYPSTEVDNMKDIVFWLRVNKLGESFEALTDVFNMTSTSLLCILGFEDWLKHRLDALQGTEGFYSTLCHGNIMREWIESFLGRYKDQYKGFIFFITEERLYIKHSTHFEDLGKSNIVLDRNKVIIGGDDKKDFKVFDKHGALPALKIDDFNQVTLSENGASISELNFVLKMIHPNGGFKFSETDFNGDTRQFTMKMKHLVLLTPERTSFDCYYDLEDHPSSQSVLMTLLRMGFLIVRNEKGFNLILFRPMGLLSSSGSFALVDHSIVFYANDDAFLSFKAE